jgi:aminoglycoside 3-N-acetyltransferase I
MRSKRLQPGDRDLARGLFALMADAFEEACEVLGDRYLDQLLAREDFWALAAFDGDEIIGGITAHTLPMTRTETAEMFIYDLAVRRDRRRTGVGRHLVATLREKAAARGIGTLFVAVDDGETRRM